MKNRKLRKHSAGKRVFSEGAFQSGRAAWQAGSGQETKEGWEGGRGQQPPVCSGERRQGSQAGTGGGCPCMQRCLCMPEQVHCCPTSLSV